MSPLSLSRGRGQHREDMTSGEERGVLAREICVTT